MMLKTFVLFILSCFSLSAQNVVHSKEEVSNMLCHDWKIDHVMINAAKIPMTANITFTFRPDHTYDVTMANDTMSGTWVFDEVQKYIALDTKKKTLRIVALDENAFSMVEVKTDDFRDTPKNSTFNAVRTD